jgi:hypothetical protein
MTITDIEFDGHAAVEITTPGLQAAIITDFGPRIARLSLPGRDNILYWAPHRESRGDWNLHGGHRVWISRPGGDECEETYLPDNHPATVEEIESGVRVMGALEPSTQTRRGFDVTISADDTLIVTNRLENCSDMLYSGGIWALTCTDPGEARYGIPLGDGSSWDTAAIVHFRTWGGGHGAMKFNDPQFDIVDRMFIINPQGTENKRMLQSHAGIIAMSDPQRDLTFAKLCPGYLPTQQYPQNTNVAVYVGPDNFMVEMESMGAEAPLKPGEVLEHREAWVLRPGAIDVENLDAVLGIGDGGLTIDY